MSIGRLITETLGYIADAVAVVFSPYGEPKNSHLVGVQPFTGEIYYDEF
jgi:hypothetical protein